MPWIESHTLLAGHRKVLGCARELRIRPVYLIGHLHAFWHTVLEQCEDGDITSWDNEFIAHAALWTGDADRFFEALTNPDRPWIDLLGGRKVVHDWLDSAGRYLESRYRTADPLRLVAIWEKHHRVYKLSKGQIARVEEMGGVPVTLSSPQADDSQTGTGRSSRQADDSQRPETGREHLETDTFFSSASKEITDSGNGRNKPGNVNSKADSLTKDRLSPSKDAPPDPDNPPNPDKITQSVGTRAHAPARVGKNSEGEKERGSGSADIALHIAPSEGVGGVPSIAEIADYISEIKREDAKTYLHVNPENEAHALSDKALTGGVSWGQDWRATVRTWLRYIASGRFPAAVPLVRSNSKPQGGATNHERDKPPRHPTESPPEPEQPAISIAEAWAIYRDYPDRAFAIKLLINSYGEQAATEFLERTSQTELAT